MRKTLIVGAGFTGAVLAERIASELGESVVVIDRRSHIGGNAYDCANEHGVIIHKYGPHIFHTNAAKVFKYLSRFTPWRPYEHRVRGLIDGQFVSLPFNLTSMEAVFGPSEGARLNKILTDEFGVNVKVPILKMRQSKSADARRIADFIYEKVFLHYTQKQWGSKPEELDESVSGRVPVHLSRDDRYFQDTYQYMPADGYAPLFEQLLANKLIEVRPSVEFTDIDGVEPFDRVIFTGPIDEFFAYVHGALPYRSIRFDNRTSAAHAPIQSATVENYPTPASEHPYTRSTEYRLLTAQQDVDFTTQTFEFPEAYVPSRNEPYYPVPSEANREIFRRYRITAARLKTVIFAGRLADYNYYNMDQAVGRALSCFEKEIVKGTLNEFDALAATAIRS
jgi:UDP-galactopyranose mutase